MFTGPARHGAPPRHARKRQAPERTVSKDNRDDLVGEVADAVTLDLDVRWDRCAERAAPADRRKIENLRVIERVFRSRPAAGEVSRTAPAGGADSRASAFVRRAVSALIAIAWAELGFSLLLLVWSWGSFYGTNGDLAVYLVTKLAGFGVGACLLLFAGGRERRTRALGLYCLLKATHASYAIIPAVLMDAPLAQMVPGWFLEVPVLPGVPPRARVLVRPYVSVDVRSRVSGRPSPWLARCLHASHGTGQRGDWVRDLDRRRGGWSNSRGPATRWGSPAR